ncbi:hypothetical protein [Streptomyces sp. NPDC051286]
MSDQYDYSPESGAGDDGAHDSDDSEYDSADAGFDDYSEYPDGRSDS